MQRTCISISISRATRLSTEERRVVATLKRHAEARKRRETERILSFCTDSPRHVHKNRARLFFRQVSLGLSPSLSSVFLVSFIRQGTMQKLLDGRSIVPHRRYKLAKLKNAAFQCLYYTYTRTRFLYTWSRG